MSNDYVLAEAIRLIKAGQKDAARVIIEPYLQKNPNNIQAWMWNVEIFSSDQDKIKVLESCLQKNPGNPQVIQALSFLKKRAGKFAATPFSTSSASSSFAEQPSRKPPPSFTESSSAKPLPFSSSLFSGEPDAFLAIDQQINAALPPLPQFETSESGKTSAPAKKAKRMSSRTKDILIVAGVCLLFALFAGGYMGGGFYLNGQIEQSFAQQNCKNVVQHTYFISLYPQGIFSFLFAGYDQYSECRFKLDVDQAVKTKDWGGSITLAQEYLTAYPAGVFAAGMDNLVASSLTAWSVDLIAEQNYGSAIEKLEQFVEAYPADPGVESAREDILQAYLTWEKDFFEAKNYVEAEQKLKSALAYFETDPARVAKIKAELVNVYISWGNQQVEMGILDNAVKYYQQAQETLPGGADANLLIAKAYLKQATDIADKNDFNRALVKVQEVAETAQAENVKAAASAAREKILAAYSASSSLQATEQITAAIPPACKGQVPQLPIFGVDKKNIRFALFYTLVIPLPDDLTAETPGQLHYVACVEEKEKEVGNCPYTGGRTLYQLRYEWAVTLYDITTGSVFNSQTFKGGNPPECKQKELFTKGVNYKKSYGSKPTVDQIVAWIRDLNIVK